MALVITHNAVVIVPDDPNYPVGSDEWNANHSLAGLLDATQLDQTAAYAFSGLGATTINGQPANTRALTISGGSITGSSTVSPGVSVSGTLNTSGVIHGAAFFANTTNTAFGGGSTVFELQSGGTPVFTINSAAIASAATVVSSSSIYGITLASTGSTLWATGSVGGSASGGADSTFVYTPQLALGAGFATDAVLGRAGANAVRIGPPNAASPVGQTLQAQGSRAGTDASTAGGNLTIQPGIGTGNAGKAAVAINGVIGSTTTTTTAQTVAAGISVPGVAAGQLPGAVIGSGALATNATDGFLYIPQCAGTPTGVPTAQTGRVPMVWDTTNKKFYIYDGAWLGGTAPGVFS